MKQDGLMKISELSRRSGIPISTIRYYILEGLLPAAVKTGKTRAYYSDAHLKALDLIRHKQTVEDKSLSVIRKEIRKEVPFYTKSKEREGISLTNKYEAILTCATSLFLKKGYAETTIADIAQNGKMSKETIYQHFKNKEEIFMACADKIFFHMFDEVWSEIKGEKDMLSRIAHRGRAFVSSYPQWASMMNLVKGLSVGDNPSFTTKFHQIIMQMIKPMMREVEVLMQEGRFTKAVDSELASFILLGMSEYGAMLASQENYSFEEIHNTITMIFEKGLSKT